MKTVCHLITGLQVGGAQHALMRLATNDEAYRHVVITMLDEDAFGPKLRAAGVGARVLVILSAGRWTHRRWLVSPVSGGGGQSPGPSTSEAGAR